jgi:hypothetical protein
VEEAVTQHLAAQGTTTQQQREKRQSAAPLLTTADAHKRTHAQMYERAKDAVTQHLAAQHATTTSSRVRAADEVTHYKLTTKRVLVQMDLSQLLALCAPRRRATQL